MNIDQLSNHIKQKTAQLDQQIASLEARMHQTNRGAAEDDQQLAADIAALQELKAKLAKSGDIARRAYELQRGDGVDEARLRQRRLAIGMCLFSGLGLLAIAAVYLVQ